MEGIKEYGHYNYDEIVVKIHIILGNADAVASQHCLRWAAPVAIIPFVLLFTLMSVEDLDTLQGPFSPACPCNPLLLMKCSC